MNLLLLAEVVRYAVLPGTVSMESDPVSAEGKEESIAAEPLSALVMAILESMGSCFQVRLA